MSEHSTAGFFGRLSYCAALLLVICAVPFAHQARAQIDIDPNSRIGGVPTFAGTGLQGFYYNDPAAAGNPDEQGNFDNSINNSIGPDQQYPLLATFLAPNICFTNCFQFLGDDASGGLRTFLNGNATHIQFTNPQAPEPGAWNNSGLILNGYIAITQIGSYNFTLQSDDGSVLSLGNYQGGSADIAFSMTGLYPIAVNFFEDGGGSGLTLNATNDQTEGCLIGCSLDDSGTPAPNTLFYNNMQLQGAPAPIIGGGWPGTAVLAVFAMAALVRRQRRRIIL